MEQGVGNAIRSLAEASAIVEQVSRRVASGGLQPTIRHGLKAAKLLAACDEAARRDRDLEGKIQRNFEDAQAALKLAKSFMSEDAWSDYLRAMEHDPRLGWLIPTPGST